METPNTQHIIPMDIERQMKSAFIDYSMSVIVSRALPDVRDGMKPVHRRILYSMYNSGLTPDKNYSKSAATAGDVIKYFHPHGEASVYDALVRLAQDFSLRYPLVDGQGNFGSVDGDPPAAMRYTESKLAKISMDMMTDIEKDTVDFVPNYDGRYKEPAVLPSRFPQLLVNGSVGIAVGMATNIPPHNLGEVIDAVVYQIDHPDATLDDLMQFIKGPDFPTGGTIVGRAGTRAAYATGRGTIRLRAKCEILEENGRRRIEVTEIPYMVNKVKLVKGIADLVKDKRIEGIADLSDHSDRLGLKIVIDLKKDANPQVVLNQLYSYSLLQENVSVIMLALSNGQPKIMTLKQMLGEYIAFQKEVITRRTRFELKRAKKRAHILEGLKIAIDNIDEVIHIIRSSKTEPIAKENLENRFGLTDEQSQAIVDMRMGRLTGLERDKLEEELRGLEAKIAEYERILVSDELQYGIVKREILEIRKKYADERRTQIELVDDELDIEDLIENEDNAFTLTQAGYVKRLPVTAYRAQRRGGRGVSGQSLREEDAVTTMFVTKTHNPVLFFTDMGRVFRMKGYQVPSASRTSKGTNIVNLLQLDADEHVTTLVPLTPVEGEDERNLVLVTREGIVKRMALSALSNIRRVGLRAVNLREGDRLVSVALTSGHDDILIASHDGQAIRFGEEEAREMGRSATGVIGIRLAEGDYVAGAVALKEGDDVLTVTENGYGKRTAESQFPKKHRAGGGVICHDLTDKTGKLAGVLEIAGEGDLLIIASDGQVLRADAADVRVCGRSSQGVILLRAAEDTRVIDVAFIEKTEDASEDEAAAELPAEELPDAAQELPVPEPADEGDGE
ncbi:MAG: DNA gyrase subunit A [Eubacteriales bacterium]|nr:DNA gyrase subunit A [Eubacteriales bacterium]MDY5015356.1 DNA gyrase subunit A [Eubacteriales bacterium]